jgi:hypothetical protein
MEDVINLPNIKTQISNVSERVEHEKKVANKGDKKPDGEGKAKVATGNKKEIPPVPTPKDDDDTSPTAECYIHKKKDASYKTHKNENCFWQHPEKAPNGYVLSKSTGKGRVVHGVDKITEMVVSNQFDDLICDTCSDDGQGAEDEDISYLYIEDDDGFVYEEMGSVKMVKGCKSSDQGSSRRIRTEFMGTVVVFEIDTDASHNMHSDEDFCKTYLVDYDESKRLRIQVANGEYVYAVGCGRLPEGGLLTEEVYCVPGIRDGDHHLGLLSTWPGMVNGVEYSQSLL